MDTVQPHGRVILLPVLLNVPRTPEQWAIFTLHHRTSHDLIRQTIRAKSGTDLSDFIIDPIPFNAVKQWLEANQQLHTDMNTALGTQGSDLEEVDITKERELQVWIYQHYLEHQTAEQTLGISS